MLVRVIAAGVVGGIVSFVSGFLVWGLALKSYFDSAMSASAKTVMSTEPNFGLLIAAQLVYGIFFAVILDWAGSRSLQAGAMSGAVIGFFMSFFMDMQMGAFMKDMYVGSPFVPIVVDILCATIVGAVVGAAVGATLGAMNKGEATPAAA